MGTRCLLWSDIPNNRTTALCAGMSFGQRLSITNRRRNGRTSVGIVGISDDERDAFGGFPR